MKRFFAFIFCVVFLGGHSLFAQQIPVPSLKARITDLAGMFSPQENRALEQKLAIFEKNTGNQIAVLVVETLGEEEIEQFSIRVVEQWKLGTEKQDNGLLLLIAKKERKVRIEVGQGFEGIITDVFSAQIIRDEILPAFRRGDFFGGVDFATDQIIQQIRQSGEFAVPDTQSNPVKNYLSSVSLLFWVFGIGLFMIIGSLIWNRTNPQVRKISLFFLIFFLICAPIAYFYSSAAPLLIVLALFILTDSTRRKHLWKILSVVFIVLGGFLMLLLASGGRGGRGGFGGGGFSGGGGGFSGGGASGSW